MQSVRSAKDYAERTLFRSNVPEVLPDQCVAGCRRPPIELANERNRNLVDSREKQRGLNLAR